MYVEVYDNNKNNNENNENQVLQDKQYVLEIYTGKEEKKWEGYRDSKNTTRRYFLFPRGGNKFGKKKRIATEKIVCNKDKRGTIDKVEKLLGVEKKNREKVEGK